MIKNKSIMFRKSLVGSVYKRPWMLVVLEASILPVHHSRQMGSWYFFWTLHFMLEAWTVFYDLHDEYCGCVCGWLCWLQFHLHSPCVCFEIIHAIWSLYISAIFKILWSLKRGSVCVRYGTLHMTLKALFWMMVIGLILLVDTPPQTLRQ